MAMNDFEAACTANISDHGPAFAPAPCVKKGPHIAHQAANGSVWLDPMPVALTPDPRRTQ